MHEEQLWFMKQQSRVLQEFRVNIQPFWDDEAAREINTRYLNQHQEDDAHMVRSFTEQTTFLDTAQANIQQAQVHALEAQKLAEKLDQLLVFIDEDVHIGHQMIDQSRGQMTIADRFMAEAEACLAQTRSVCEGVATT